MPLMRLPSAPVSSPTALLLLVACTGAAKTEDTGIALAFTSDWTTSDCPSWAPFTHAGATWSYGVESSQSTDTGTQWSPFEEMDSASQGEVTWQDRSV